MATLSKEPITYPQDFESTAVPELGDLDKNMRCLICKEILRDAMITNCGHTFCNGCIRDAVTAAPRCPHCDQSQVKFFKNWFARELVGWWNKTRPKLLDVVSKPEEPEAVPESGTPRRKRPITEVEEVESPRYKTRGAKNKSLPTSSDKVISIDSDEDATGTGSQMVDCPFQCGDRMREDQVWDHISCCPKNEDATVRAPPGYVPPLDYVTG